MGALSAGSSVISSPDVDHADHAGTYSPSSSSPRSVYRLSRLTHRRGWSLEDVVRACTAGDVHTIRRIHKRNSTKLLSVHGPDGCTPLLLACKHGHIALAKFFLEEGASIQDRDADPKRQGNAVHYAAWGGHLNMVRWLLQPEQGGSLDDLDVVGNTPLLYAIYGGHRHLVDFMVDHGRSLSERNTKNHTALLQAACGGHLHLVKWLLSQGFTVNESDHDGNTALLFAAWGGHLGLIQYLLEHGSNLSEKNHNGHSIMLSAANGGRVEIVEWLLTQGFDLTETNNNGDTALLLAAYGGHLDLVQRLLKMGASLKDKNACGFTPLLSAANGGQLEMAKWLLQHGSSLKEADYDGYTSLILAACGGNIELVKFFLAKGSDIKERNSNGDTALLLAAYCGNRDLVDWLLANGSELSEKNDTGMGPLISAANGGDAGVVELLLQRVTESGPNCGDSIENTDEGGYTPLLLAAQRGHLKVVRLLAQYGANHNAQTTAHHNTALSLAVDFPNVISYLKTIAGWRPLQIAAEARNKDRIIALLQSGALPSHVGAESAPTALAIAKTNFEYNGATPVDQDVIALLHTATEPWGPQRHALFPARTRRTVFRTMLLMHRLAFSEQFPILPTEMWMHILSFLPRESDSRASEQSGLSAFEIGWQPVKAIGEASSSAAAAACTAAAARMAVPHNSVVAGIFGASLGERFYARSADTFAEPTSPGPTSPTSYTAQPSSVESKEFIFFDIDEENVEDSTPCNEASGMGFVSTHLRPTRRRRKLFPSPSDEADVDVDGRRLRVHLSDDSGDEFLDQSPMMDIYFSDTLVIGSNSPREVKEVCHQLCATERTPESRPAVFRFAAHPRRLDLIL